MTQTQTSDPHRLFGTELRRRRESRGLKVRALAQLVRYTFGHVSNVENGHRPATEEFAAACDRALNAGGELIRFWHKQFDQPRLAQLPAALANLIGRADDMHSLNEAVAGPTDPGVPRVVVVEGPAGIGKTSLVVTWGHRVADRFPNGQLYVDLRGFTPDGHAPLEPAAALERFLIALGASAVPATLGERAAMYRNMVAEQRLLIVLDNAADATQVEPLLPSSPGCTVAITSRARLAELAVRTAARRITLGPLDTVDAALVLASVVGAERTAAEPDAVSVLVKGCAGLPLALRLCAERIASHPLQRVAEVVAELRSGFGNPRPSVLPKELIALHAAFSGTYRNLDQRSAALFRFLGLYPGRSISLAAMSALPGITTSTARILLSRLNNVHLVEAVSPDRYRVHERLWCYASERAHQELPADERFAAFERLAAWYLHTARAAGSSIAPWRARDPVTAPPPGVHPLRFASRGEAVRWCDAEADNVAAVVRRAADEGLNVVAWQLALAISDYFSLRRPWATWEETHTAARRAARQAHDSRAEGALFRRLAEAARLKHDFAEAELLSATALAIARHVGDRQGEALALISAALSAVDSGQFKRGGSLATRAQALLGEDSVEVDGLACALGIRGQALLAAGQPEAGRTLLIDALTRFNELRCDRGSGWTLCGIAAVDDALGRPDAAVGALNDAVAAYSRADDRWNVAHTLVIRADLLAKRGQVTHALRSWRLAMEFYQQVGDRRAVQIAQRLSTGAVRTTDDGDAGVGNEAAVPCPVSTAWPQA